MQRTVVKVEATPLHPFMTVEKLNPQYRQRRQKNIGQQRKGSRGSTLCTSAWTLSSKQESLYEGNPSPKVAAEYLQRTKYRSAFLCLFLFIVSLISLSWSCWRIHELAKSELKYRVICSLIYSSGGLYLGHTQGWWRGEVAQLWHVNDEGEEHPELMEWTGHGWALIDCLCGLAIVNYWLRSICFQPHVLP